MEFIFNANKKRFHDRRYRASLLALSSELISKCNIITLPESANYECQDTLNVLLHAATSSTGSLESASNDLQRKNPDFRIHSADTIFNYIKENKIEDILSSFRKMNLELFKMMKLENNIHDIAIDFHDISYYGDKNTPGIRGIKLKNGSSWDKSFCTLDITGTSHLTLDVIDINSLNKNCSHFIESLFKRLEIIGVKTGTSYLDKEFFNTYVISKLDELKVNFVIAAKSNQVINRELKNHQKEYGNTSTIFEYQFQKRGPSFNVVAIYNDKRKSIFCLLQTKKQNQLRSAGCDAIEGKVYWAQYIGADAYPIYKCVKEKGYQNCGDCSQIPCELWVSLKDPSLSEVEHQKSIQDRLLFLKGLR